MNDILVFNRIDSFSGDNSFLSNFHGGSVTVSGYTFKTAEHAYQALKATTMEDFDYVANCSTPGEAKRAGRKIKINPDWDSVKVETMRVVLRAKFSNNALANKLIATGSAHLVEGNTWGDTFWGECGGIGENNLGKLLMELRSELLTFNQLSS